jgi:hypothetical protein
VYSWRPIARVEYAGRFAQCLSSPSFPDLSDDVV